MKQWLLVFILLPGLLLPPAGLFAQAVRTVPEALQDSAGSRVWVNWSDYTIRATGRGEAETADSRHHAPYQAAARARQKAYRLLLKAGKSVHLTPTRTVGDALGDDDQQLAAFENLVRQAEAVRTEFLSNGPVEVTLELSLAGSFSSLLLPDAVTRLEEIESGQAKTDPEGGAHTGLVVDARGLAVTPALCFQVLDEDGKEVYGPAYASREHVVAAGMCRYVPGISNIDQYGRTGENPLIVKAMRVRPPGASDIVISDTDASRLKSSVAHLAFLRNCRVIIVLDPVKQQ